MPKDFQRTERVAQVIQRELAELIQRGGVRDPRLSTLLSISAVEVTRDLAYAKIYVVLPDDEATIKTNIKILNKAAGFMRSHLARQLTLRTTPKLTFLYDASLAYGNKMQDLIDQALADDHKETDEVDKPEETIDRKES